MLGSQGLPGLDLWTVISGHMAMEGRMRGTPELHRDVGQQNQAQTADHAAQPAAAAWALRHSNRFPAVSKESVEQAQVQVQRAPPLMPVGLALLLPAVGQLCQVLVRPMRAITDQDQISRNGSNHLQDPSEAAFIGLMAHSRPGQKALDCIGGH